MSESNLLYCLLKKVFCLIPFNTYCDLLFYDRKYLRCLGNLLYFIGAKCVRDDVFLNGNFSTKHFFLRPRYLWKAQSVYMIKFHVFVLNPKKKVTSRPSFMPCLVPWVAAKSTQRTFCVYIQSRSQVTQTKPFHVLLGRICQWQYSYNTERMVW